MKYIAIVVLIIFSAFFSSMETAFSTVNKIRLKHEASKGDKRAKQALSIAEKYDRAITAILIGNNIVNIMSASLGTVIFTEIFGASGVGIATAVMTVLVLVFGEILPKSLAKENAERLCLSFAGLLSFIILILTPFVWIFSKLKALVSHMYSNQDTSPSVTEDELKYIIDEIEDQGVLEEQESELVRSALDFDEISVDQILVPRVRVVAVERTDSLEHIKNIFLQQRYSRLPVYDKTIDNVVGIVHEKDVFSLMMKKNPPASINSIIQKAIYILDTKMISEALKEMQKSKIHMAIVKDQYGGTSGIVTLEDIIEELVGEIYDENDEVENPVIITSDGEYIISCELSINDMLEHLDLPEGIIESESNTVGGWVMELFGDIPSENEVTENELFIITVLSIQDQRVAKIKLKIKPTTSEE